MTTLSGLKNQRQNEYMTCLTVGEKAGNHGYKNVISGKQTLLPVEEALSRHDCGSNSSNSCAYVELLFYNSSSKQTSTDRYLLWKESG